MPAVVRYLWCTRIKYTREFGGFLKKMFWLKTNSTDGKRGRTNVLYMLSFSLVFSRCIVLQTSVSTNSPGSKAYVLVLNGTWHPNVHYCMVGIIALSKSRRVTRLHWTQKKLKITRINCSEWVLYYTTIFDAWLWSEPFYQQCIHALCRKNEHFLRLENQIQLYRTNNWKIRGFLTSSPTPLFR